jgi:nucleotide-binding universal stress UspA family protein
VLDLKTILLPVDFSGRSLEAARQVKGIARRVRCRLILLNVLDNRRGELQFEAGGWCAQELQSYINREFGETPVEYVAQPGAPADIIERVARERGADLIVITGHNREPFEALALGSVTAEVLSSASCPVWVSLHEERGTWPLFRRILCPVRLLDSTDSTLDWALQFVHAFDATCDVIHVARNSGGHEPRRMAEDWLTNAERERLGAIKRKLDGRGQVILAAGDPAKVIAAASGGLKYDLLVTGRHRS